MRARAVVDDRPPAFGSSTRADRITLCFTGDVALTDAALDGSPGSLPEKLSGFRDIFADHDLVVGNLEVSVCPDEHWEAHRGHRMAVARKRLAGLRDAGFGAFSLANNHMMDCGPPALASVTAELDRQGIAWFGAGRTLAEATGPRIVTVRGRRIALYGVCDFSHGYATARRPGIAPLDRGQLERAIRDARGACDLIVVSMHADVEFRDYPSPWRMRLARRLIGAGANLVVQHHPHVFQGYEHFGKGFIAYSLGNFAFKINGDNYQDRKSGTRDGLLLSLYIDFGETSDPAISATFIPIAIGDDHFPHLIFGRKRQALLDLLDARSAALIDPAVTRRAWRTTSREEIGYLLYESYIAVARGHWRQGLARGSLLLTTPERRRWIVGWLTRGWT